MEPIVFGTARGKIVLLLLVSCAFVAAGVFIMASGRPGGAAVGWMSILFFGGCAAIFARQLFDARPRIVIDESGVFDRTLKVGVIAWADILDAQVMHVRSNAFIALRLTDPGKYTGRLGAVHRRMTQLNGSLGFAPLNLNLAAIDTDPYALAALIVREAEVRRAPPRDAYRS